MVRKILLVGLWIWKALECRGRHAVTNVRLQRLFVLLKTPNYSGMSEVWSWTFRVPRTLPRLLSHLSVSFNDFMCFFWSQIHKIDPNQHPTCSRLVDNDVSGALIKMVIDLKIAVSPVINFPAATGERIVNQGFAPFPPSSRFRFILVSFYGYWDSVKLLLPHSEPFKVLLFQWSENEEYSIKFKK